MAGKKAASTLTEGHLVADIVEHANEIEIDGEKVGKPLIVAALRNEGLDFATASLTMAELARIVNKFKRMEI